MVIRLHASCFLQHVSLNLAAPLWCIVPVSKINDFSHRLLFHSFIYSLYCFTTSFAVSARCCWSLRSQVDLLLDAAILSAGEDPGDEFENKVSLHQLSANLKPKVYPAL